MAFCNLAVSAHINGKEQPNKLYVHGSVLVYTMATEVNVSEAVPQGINSQILILNVTVKHVDGPMKGTCRPFEYVKEVNGRQYDQVTINIEGGQSSTVIVSYMG
ncbi:hypothetical protein [Cellvibrio sp. PSBB006]|uniref:hypothetical protein n=1 Tax=Cellvibrio sp. PSBB006 TaxID=1987723 RepID=UPI000B3B4B73|nr:hypothetical protein [Cellvibrio sp. PSBB006]ARU29863.1 hypothetical protein CBR65_21835 [Cellvibrio sp. PSBB006]